MMVLLRGSNESIKLPLTEGLKARALEPLKTD